MELKETIKYIENIINATYITATLKDKDGDIIEQGTHDELLKKKGFYAELYNSQFEKVEEI